MHFVLVTETPLITPSELYSLSKAMEVNGAHCAEAWGMKAPAVDIIEKRSRLPKDTHPIVFMDRETDPGALAVHYWDPLQRGPAARVLVQRASGVNEGGHSVSESACHELVEAMVDPQVDLWRPYPGKADGTEVALEIADPCQDHYRVIVDNISWRVANFVTPHWFRSDLVDYAPRRAFLDAGGKFDWCSRLDRPGEIGTGGYAIVRTRTTSGAWRVQNVRRNGEAFSAEDDKAHAWARTFRRTL